MTERQLAAIMAYVHDLDKELSLKDCLERFDRRHVNDQLWWLKQARRYLAEVG